MKRSGQGRGQQGLFAVHAGGLTWSEGVSVLAQLAVFLAAVLEPLHQAAHTHSNHRTSQLPCYVYATTEHLNSHVMSIQLQNISTPMLCHATTEQLNSHVMSMQLQNISTLMSMSLQLQNISALTLCLCNRRTSQLPCCVYGTTKQLNSHVMSM